MGASERQRAEGLDPGFWERFERLESRHRRAQWEHERAQRGLKRLPPGGAEELQQAWQRYCEVIAELDCATAEIESLRTCAS
jgi:broad specificity phosphatase PhoE